MIDLHAHLLPGVDDGSPSEEVSLEMARLAVESGVSELVVTPHCGLPDDEGLRAHQLARHTEALACLLAQEGIALRLHTGMEIFGLPDTAEKLRTGELCTLAGSRYPLIEFPFTDYAYEATAVLDEVLQLGLRPIVAHPERYRYAQRDPRLLELWTDMGCLLQLNRGSLLGRFGEREEALAHSLVARGFAAFVASDAHGSAHRTPWMRDVHTLLAREYGAQTAQRLLEDAPRCVLQNERIQTERPDRF